MLNFALFSIAKGGKNAPSMYPALEASILIRNGNLTCKNPKQKALSKYLICRTSYEYLK